MNDTLLTRLTPRDAARLGPHSNLAVIGAGLAGITCAAALQRAGLTVTVFEKSRGTGGRMSTRRGDGWQCDHGAQFFTARDADFMAEVARWRRAGVADLWNSRVVTLDAGAAALARAGAPMADRFVGVPRMTAPVQWLAEPLTVLHKRTVTSLEVSQNSWRLSTDEAGTEAMLYDAVVLAIPTMQASKLLREPAPQLAAIADNATMRSCWALMLQGRQPAALDFDAAFVRNSPLAWVARDSSKPQRNGMETWVLHASASWSEAHLQDHPDDVINALLEAFTHLGGIRHAQCTAHRWRYASTASTSTLASVWQPDVGLGLCGDWLHGGKVEAAWLSGRALANEVLKSASLNAR